MLKQSQSLKLLQKISPQQIQLIKLLQVPTAALEQRVKEELERNPALEDTQMGFGEESAPEPYSDLDTPASPPADMPAEQSSADVNIEDYLTRDNDYDQRTRLASNEDDEDDYETPIVQLFTLYDQLQEQLSLLSLDEKSLTIAENIIGNIDEEGYFRGRNGTDPVKALVSYLAFRLNMRVTAEEVEQVLHEIQRFDPPGVGARDLQECLVLQLRRKEPTHHVLMAITVIEKYFDELSKKHFSKIRSKLGVSEEELKEVYTIITRLNPKPGDSQTVIKHEHIIPDFSMTTEHGRLHIRLNGRNAPDLKVSRNYINMFQEYKRLDRKRKDPKIRETLEFLKQRLEAAQWFIDAIRQRQITLLKTMESIADMQQEFFLSGGDEKKLRPMILKDIAEQVGMDISTVSRVANSKYVETEFGIYPLKFFFTEGIETEDGLVSNREVKKALEEIIQGESKRRPLSDDKIADMLKKKGYNIARRTVAKYREQLGVPVARMRKDM